MAPRSRPTLDRLRALLAQAETLADTIPYHDGDTALCKASNAADATVKHLRTVLARSETLALSSCSPITPEAPCLAPCHPASILTR